MSRAPKKYWNRFKCYTLLDWENYLAKNPSWHNRFAIEMLNDLGKRARAFYKSFVYWLSLEYSLSEEIIIRQKYFPKRENIYNNQRNGRKGTNKFSCYSLEDWEQYKLSKKNWHGKSSTEIVGLGGEAKSFYFVFYNWLRQTFPKNREKRVEILNEFFPPKKRKTA